MLGFTWSNPPEASTQFWSAVFGIPMLVFCAPACAVFYVFQFFNLADSWIAIVAGIASIPFFWGTLIYGCTQLYRGWKNRHRADEPTC
jgi:hypothetical protein